jgi:lipoprotein-anchoring transpeptidase ErfK/SrfK
MQFIIALGFSLLTVIASAQQKVEVQPTAGMPTVPAPIQYPASFSEQDFFSKPWMTNYKYVVVINKSTEGSDKQSIRIYRNGKIVSYSEIASFLSALNPKDRADLKNLDLVIKKAESNKNTFGSQPTTDMYPEIVVPRDVSVKSLKETYEVLEKTLNERSYRIDELAKKQWSPNVFKVSTGRDQFEKKGEHHSQNDSWTVTPTGYYTAQFYSRKHKSESYSNSMCDSALGKFIGKLAKKELCTYMEFAVFFNRAIAVHKAIPGTEGMLGKKASGGCVRLPGALAEFIYNVTNEAVAPIPMLNNSGELAYGKDGRIQFMESIKSVWPLMPTRSVLFIVHDTVK